MCYNVLVRPPITCKGENQMTEPVFSIQTKMERQDYRKFLYIATFCRNKLTIPIIVIIALAASLLVNWKNGTINLLGLVLTWIFMFALSIGVICLQVESKNKRRITTDKTGTFESTSLLSFYEDKVVIENKALNSTGELKYDQFFDLLESKEYFIFYITANQASLIRKKDVEDVSAFKAFIVSKFQNRYRCINR